MPSLGHSGPHRPTVSFASNLRHLFTLSGARQKQIGRMHSGTLRFKRPIGSNSKPQGEVPHGITKVRNVTAQRSLPTQGTEKGGAMARDPKQADCDASASHLS